MIDQRQAMNRRVPVRFVRGCMCAGRAFAEGAEADLDALDAGLLFGQGAVVLRNPADLLLLREAAQTDFRNAESHFKRLERSRR